MIFEKILKHWEGILDGDEERREYPAENSIEKEQQSSYENTMYFV